MLPSTQDILGSMPSPEQTGWGHGGARSQDLRGRGRRIRRSESPRTAQLVLTTPRDRKLWGFVVAFMSRIKGRVYFTTAKQLEKSKSLSEGSHSCFLCQLSPLILHPLAQIFWEEESLTLSIWTCPFTALYLVSVFTGMCLTASLILNGMFGTQIRQLGNSCCS